MNIKYIVGLLLFFICINFTWAQSTSVLSSGNWYKLAVEKSGIYKLDRTNLSDLGIDVNNLDPATIQIYGNQGGMLPQPNDSTRPAGLQENAIEIIGGEDGSFDMGDLVVFYGEGPDYYHFENNGHPVYQYNIYDRKNYYFLTTGQQPGKRIQDINNEGIEYPKITSFDDIQHHELTLNNLLLSGRNWYGEKFDITPTYTIEFETPGIVNGSDVTIDSKVMAQSFAPSSFQLSINNTPLGEQLVESVPDFTQKSFRYSVKGKEEVSSFQVNSAEINNTSVLSLKYTYEKNSSGQSLGFLDWVTIHTQRVLKWYGQTTIFQSLKSLDNAVSTFEISSFNGNLSIWNITQPNNPGKQKFTQISDKALFGASNTTLEQYIVFDPNEVPSPEFIGAINNQNLHALNTPELLIITHPDFKSQAQRLANFRQSHDGLSVHVVTTENIYNEFSSGRQDVTAIRDFVRHLYNKNYRLKYLLLFGRGSYDYLDVIPNNTNFVPIYESRNSLHPLNTYGSDDYYGFLEDNEGEWSEDGNGDHTLDIGVGRLPVTSSQEAEAVISKIIRYGTDEKNFGKWRNTITFVADDGDGNLHQRQSNELTQFVDTSYQSFNPNKLFLDSYKQISRPNGEISPSAEEALNNAIDEGALIVNFTGHGGESGWMQEQVLDLVTIREWNNKYRLPLFVTATCEFGRHDDPRRVSGGELIVTNENGGGVGIVSTCRPVSSSSNFELNKAFYNNIFQRTNNEYPRLGDVFKATKNNPNVNQVGNRNFALLGDPSLKLSYPGLDIKIDNITNNGIEMDTINALSNVSINGSVKQADGTLSANFNGILYVVVYDKESLFTTLGDENPPFNYYDKENVIFRGKATIKNGLFNLGFIVPKNISYLLDQGKISLYAVNDNNTKDASGAKLLTVGGSNPNPASDTKGPKIEVYLGDTINTNYTDIASNTRLIAYLEDKSGINLSGYGVGNSLEVIIDDSISYILNDYYEAATDNYEEGWINAPINNLTKGPHSLTLKAWDTFNNSSTKSIEFNVLDPKTLSISRLYNSPNPFNESTNFRIQHNRAGEDIDIKLDILDRMGGIVQKFHFAIEDSNSNINLVAWDGTNSNGKKLSAGLYIYRVTVRSNKDGAINKRYARLVLIN